jgi:hypothetical protein
MKNLIIAGAFVLLSITGAYAQSKPEASNADKAWVWINTEMLAAELKLNDAQKEDLRRIDERYVKKHDAMMAVVPKPTDEERSKKVEALMKERDAELRAVFNKEQYAKWEKKRQQGTSELEETEKQGMKQ